MTLAYDVKGAMCILHECNGESKNASAGYTLLIRLHIQGDN